MTNTIETLLTDYDNWTENGIIAIGVGDTTPPQKMVEGTIEELVVSDDWECWNESRIEVEAVKVQIENLTDSEVIFVKNMMNDKEVKF